MLKEASLSLMKESLIRGDRLDQMLALVGFSDNIVTQISLADKHGNLLGSLTKIETYMLRMTKVRKKLMEVATYPILLLGFLILIMLGLKNYLLPQLLEGDGKNNWAVQLVQIFPQLFFVSLCGLLVLGLILYLWVKRQSALVFYRRMAKIPFIGQTVRLYTTAYYAREWGNLLGQGVDLLDLVALMQEQKSKLFRELGADLEEALMLGQSFPERIASHPFFTKELSLIIAYGEANARLGYELEVYAEEVWQNFFNRLNKATTFVQPLIFVITNVSKYGRNDVMKLMLKKLNAVKLRAFTLIEMLVVLLIISILLLLFVPNLSKQKDSVKETGNAAVVKVVDSQAELYEMKNNKTASLAALVSEGQITQKQADSYNDYYAKHGGESRSVAN